MRHLPTSSAVSDSGLAYLFADSAGDLVETAEITPQLYGTEPDGNFGDAVAVGESGGFQYAIVTEPGGGGGFGTFFAYDVANILSPSLGTVLQFGGAAIGDGLGYSVSAHDNFAVVGAPWRGANGTVSKLELTSISPFTFAETMVTPIVAGGETGVAAGSSVSLGDTGAVAFGLPLYDDVTATTGGVPNDLDQGQVRIWDDVSSATPNETSVDSANDNMRDQFGYAVDIEGDRMAVSAPSDDEPNPRSGMVSVFERAGQYFPWVLVAIIRSPQPEDLGFFGDSLDLFGDRIAIGESDRLGDQGEAGRVWVFERQGSGAWTVLGAPILQFAGATAYDGFGASVAFVDSSRLIIGAPGRSADAGGVFATAYSGGWSLPVQLTTGTVDPLDRVGWSVAAGSGPSGQFAVAGAPGDDDAGPDAGAIYIWQDIGAGFGAGTAVQKVADVSDFGANDGAGRSVATDGYRIAVAGLGNQSAGQAFNAHVFEVSTPGSPNVWGEMAEVFRGPLPATVSGPANQFVDIFGGTLMVGRPGNGGQVGIFRYNGVTWSDVANTPDDILVMDTPVDGDRVGFSVALEGRQSISGAPGVSTLGTLAGAVTLLDPGLVATFIGAVDDDWATPGNWDTGIVPEGSDVAIIPSGATVEVAGNVETGGVLLMPGGKISVGDAAELSLYNGFGGPSQIGGTIEIQSGGTLYVASDDAFELVGGTIDNLDEGLIDALASDEGITIAGSGTWNNSGEMSKRGGFPVTIGAGITWNSDTTSNVVVQHGDLVFEMPVFEQGTVDVMAAANVIYEDDFTADSSATIRVELDGPPPSTSNFGTLSFNSTSAPGFGSATLQTYGSYTPVGGDVYDVMSCYECGTPDLVYDVGFLQPSVIGPVPGQTLQLALDVIVVDTLDGFDSADGLCSLREAIIAANTDTPNDSCSGGAGADRIVFGVSGIIPLTAKLPNITSDITIDGSGQSISVSGQGSVAIMTVDAAGIATLIDLTFTGGSTQVCNSDTCGAVVNFGELNVDGVSFVDNTPGGLSSGGAIANYAGALTVANSTFSGNSAPLGAGAIWNREITTITNSTFVGNSGQDGGAVYNAEFGLISVANSTFSGNSAVGGVFQSANELGSSAELTNTIIASSSGSDCVGSVAANSFNIDTDGTCGSASSSGSLNLDVLGDNDGSTETVALLAGSSAIGAGDPAVCSSPPVNGLDQRGVVREATGCDVGAYEVPTLVVDTTSDAGDFDTGDSVCETASGNGVCTLRAAIQQANASTGVDRIHFAIPGGGVQTISPTSGLPAIAGPVTVDATTQLGADCSAWPPTLQVELDLTNAGGAGLALADDTSVRGLAIDNMISTSVTLNGTGNRLECNFIGADAAATPTPDGFYGIVVNGDGNSIGGSAATQANLIVGAGMNSSIRLFGDSNVIQGNHINVDLAGDPYITCCVSELIWALGSNNVIGGTNPGEGNRLGLRLSRAVASVQFPGNPATGNQIRGNSIVRDCFGPCTPSNLGIDLENDYAVAVNDLLDADVGANNLQNYPVVTTASDLGSSTQVVGTFNSTASRSFEIDVYADTECHGSGFGEGETYLGLIAVTTDGAGNATFDTTIPVALAAGSVITTTAVDMTTGDTSEFSACISVTQVTLTQGTVNSTGDDADANPGDGVCQTTTPGECTLRAAIAEANALPGADTITFDIPGPGPHRIQPLTDMTSLQSEITIDGYSQPGASRNTLSVGSDAVLLIELNGQGAPGLADAGSDRWGLYVNSTGSNSHITGLVINGYTDPSWGEGIKVQYAGGVVIEGNLIGTDPTGTFAIPNRQGIRFDDISSNAALHQVGGPAPGERNVISGNLGYGIWNGRWDSGKANVIQGNYIGTNAAGTAAIANLQAGIFVEQTTSPLIGGFGAGDGNLISGNNVGISGQQTPATIYGNLIGTDATGLLAVPNNYGIQVTGAGAAPYQIGDAAAGGRNVISGNTQGGVYADSTVWVRGNHIGVGIDGTTPLGNGNFGGVRVTTSGNRVGNQGVGDGNVIAYNSVGVTIAGGVNNSVVGNSMFDNVGAGLVVSGVGVNDAGDSDVGVNRQQNYPEITPAIVGDSLVVDYSIDSLVGSSTYPIQIDVYKADSAVSGEGRVWLGRTTVGAPGSYSLDLGDSAALGVLAADSLVATATDDTGNTSIFSPVGLVAQVVPANKLISDAAGSTQFGTAVDVEGDWAVVAESNLPAAGVSSVYVLERDAISGAWSIFQELEFAIAPFGAGIVDVALGGNVIALVAASGETGIWERTAPGAAFTVATFCRRSGVDAQRRHRRRRGVRGRTARRVAVDEDARNVDAGQLRRLAVA